MGAGGEERVRLAGQGNGRAVVAEEIWMKPFYCGRCKKIQKNGAPLSYVNKHAQYHIEADQKEAKFELERQAKRAQKMAAAGPSAQRKLNRKKDMRAEQRGRNGSDNNNASKSKGKGDKGKGKAARGGDGDQ